MWNVTCSSKHLVSLEVSRELADNRFLTTIPDNFYVYARLSDGTIRICPYHYSGTASECSMQSVDAKAIAMLKIMCDDRISTYV